MRRFVLFLLLAITILVQSARTLATGLPPDDTPGNGIISESPLVGTWYCIDYGFHGYTEYYWSFGEDGRFAYYVTGYEPPQGDGIIDSSVGEWFVQGRYRESGSTIECYDIKADSYFAWGNEWKYFPDRDPALLAGTLLATPLQESEKADDFALGFELNSKMSLRLEIDRGDFLHQYGMDFEYIGIAATVSSEYGLTTQILAMEQAMDLLYEKYVDSELFYPGELNTQVSNTLFYGFVYDDGDSYRYVWVSSMTGGVEFADEIENYTGKGVSADTAGMSDGELIGYLLASVPEAYERVVVMRGGLTAHVTGETTTLSNGVCRDVRLGTEDGSVFAPVITYTISPFGSVYEHDPETGAWTAVYVKPTD